MSGDDVAIEGPMVGDKPARDVGDTGFLPLDHGVAEVHVGSRLVDEALSFAVDDELRRHHSLVEHELHSAIRPLDGREPPGLVEQVGGGADLLAGADPVAGGRGVAETPILLHGRLVLFAPCEVVVESAGRQDDPAPGADPQRCTVFHDGRAGHRPVVVGEQFRHR